MSAKARKPKKQKKKASRSAGAGGARGKSASSRTGAKSAESDGKRTKVSRKKKTPVAPRKVRAKKSTTRRRKAPTVRVPRLTPSQRVRYRELLLQKQRELTDAYYLSKSNSISDMDDGTEDYIDYAVHSYAREFLLSLTELDRKQLFLVEEALERIQRGGYGVCCQCGRAIHLKRLEVAPWARYCLPCQELEEKGMLPQLGSFEEAAGRPEKDQGEDADPEEDEEEMEEEDEESEDAQDDEEPVVEVEE